MINDNGPGHYYDDDDNDDGGYDRTPFVRACLSSKVLLALFLLHTALTG